MNELDISSYNDLHIWIVIGIWREKCLTHKIFVIGASMSYGNKTSSVHFEVSNDIDVMPF